jgi:hypothetical protein
VAKFTRSLARGVSLLSGANLPDSFWNSAQSGGKQPFLAPVMHCFVQ